MSSHRSTQPKLKGMLPLWSWTILNLLLCVAAIADNEIKAFLELTELEYEDACYKTAEAEWAFINSPTNRSLLSIWEKEQMQYREFKKIQRTEVASIWTDSLNDPTFRYKHDVIVKAGDALMDEEDWRKFVHLAGSAESLRASAVYTRKSEKFSYDDVGRLLSQSGNVESKRDVWRGWHKELIPLVANFSETLSLTQKAAAINGFDSVKEYWEALSGYPDGYDKMKYEWNKITSFHKRILEFARAHLSHKYNVSNINQTIPAYLLGTLDGYDWSSITIDLQPHADITYSIRKNLWKKKLIGKSLYKSASSMGVALFSQVPEANFWQKSQFNKRCPARLINFCRDGTTRVSTCFEATVSNYLTAHKNIGRILLNQMSSEDTPTLNIANRYSGIEEGISELFGVLSASPAWLSNMHLIKKSNATEEHEIVSLMITALDIFPRLAYYVSVDMWRLHAIEANITDPTELMASWWKYRQEYEGITSEDSDVPTFLDDNHITSNKPYLSKFLGTLLSFQLYEYLMDSTEVRYDRIHPKKMDVSAIKMIQHGAADNWMAVLEKHLEIDSIYSDPLLSFFSPLENFLDEMEEEFDYKIGGTEESELEEVKRVVIEEMNAPSTTPSTTTTTRATKPTLPNTTARSEPDSKNKKGLQSESSVQADKPDDNSSSPKVPVKVPSEMSESPDTEDDKPKINTSKAVWAVSAVLIAIIAISVIALFGRQRCRKTPKNRRYV